MAPDLHRENLERTRALSAAWRGPKSRCRCGHSGDGTNSAHLGLFGHGRCDIAGCDCSKFSWAAYLPAFNTALLGVQKFPPEE
jgi:hypothetical protein